jgi:hypothetical protein
MLGVGDRVADDVLEENLEHAAGLFVDEARDTLHASTAGEATDGGFADTCKEGWCQWTRRVAGGRHEMGRTLDVVAKNLALLPRP